MPHSPEQSPERPLFALGRILATPGALDALAESREDARVYLRRHVTGDWTEMPLPDQEENRRAVRHGSRVFSSYTLRSGRKLWVITEYDRSVTTLLLPSEY